ncbi:hypothetical protein [Microbacterium immunditiarum]|uniref:DUF2975 domain-containing protein n=1 Tax=Microbacterium immunditiarum TaxID=337480 RepID=A0A7Y9KJV4_9MICO|nr:hypothetical protein [Microbacterium immunditiarum]NYE18159.1 hypothetical protein [Microbacterium immunditiarum]
MSLAIMLAAIVLPVVLIIAVFRARKTETATPIVRIALIVSATWAGLALISTVVIAVFWFTPNAYPFFTLRSEPYWPARTAWDAASGVDVDGLGLQTGGFTTASVTASGLSLPTRVMLASGDVLAGLVTVVLAGLVAFTCFRLLRGRPFAPELARLTLIAGATCLVAGFASQVLVQLGGSAATGELIRGGMAPAGLVADTGLTLDFWPLWVAIGLGAFSVFLRYGVRLERDTELLV